ncbi:MAG TPA: DUF4157 domain-containing protein, partial [Longimicrobiaceae bacterium]|nr:DUF4157 domain-containing protein [Longimicrobiaceae bacterium]
MPSAAPSRPAAAPGRARAPGRKPDALRGASSGMALTRLQRAAGNQALSRLLAGRGGTIQPKLMVGPVGDAYERQADAAADAVMAGRRVDGVASAAPLALRRCACGGTCAHCREGGDDDDEPHLLRRAPEGGAAAPGCAPPIVHRVLGAAGGPLGDRTRGAMEARFGADFSAVRVHTGEDAAASARAVGARAYTVGRDVVFAAGEYRPETPGGRHLLAHELAHVLQQSPRGVLRRAPGDPPAPPPGGAAPPPAPPKFSQLDVKPSLNGAPCACLVFVHNEERNARTTAGLMHANCAYNLAIVAPDKPGERNIKIGKGPAEKDPNELFPPAIARACHADPKACEADVAANAAAPTLDSTQKQFFLAIARCSNGFALPVV